MGAPLIDQAEDGLPRELLAELPRSLRLAHAGARRRHRAGDGEGGENDECEESLTQSEGGCIPVLRIEGMADGTALTVLARLVRDRGLTTGGSSGVVLVRGGAASTAAATGLVGELASENVVALHLNYGLRAGSDGDQAICEALCARLGIELEVERPVLGEGNVQAEARRARYAAAERLRLPRGVGFTGSRPTPHGLRP